MATDRDAVYGTFDKAAAVTTSDSADLPTVALALFCGGAGTLKVTTTMGSIVTFTGVVAGSIIPIKAKKVFLTGTTATNIMALYNS